MEIPLTIRQCLSCTSDQVYFEALIADARPDRKLFIVKCKQCRALSGDYVPALTPWEQLRQQIAERGCSECGHSPRTNPDGTCPILRGQLRCPRADFPTKVGGYIPGFGDKHA